MYENHWGPMVFYYWTIVRKQLGLVHKSRVKYDLRGRIQGFKAEIGLIRVKNRAIPAICARSTTICQQSDVIGCHRLPSVAISRKSAAGRQQAHQMNRPLLALAWPGLPNEPSPFGPSNEPSPFGFPFGLAPQPAANRRAK